MRIRRTSDFAHPDLSAYANVRERDLVGREGRFIAEGEVVLRVLASSRPYAIESVAITERRLGKVTSFLSALDVDVWVLPDEAMQSLTGIDLHRGILAIGRRLEATTATEAIGGPPPSIALGLIGIANHDNVGGIFRNAAAFGVRGVLLDGECCDPLYRKAIRVSVGGVFKVPFLRAGDSQGVWQSFVDEGYEALALSPQGDESLDALKVDSTSKVALLLGTEGRGLPNEVLAKCRQVRVKMKPGFDSLNVAATSAIALHHFFAGRS